MEIVQTLKSLKEIWRPEGRYWAGEEIAYKVQIISWTSITYDALKQILEEIIIKMQKQTGEMQCDFRKDSWHHTKLVWVTVCLDQGKMIDFTCTDFSNVSHRPMWEGISKAGEATCVFSFPFPFVVPWMPLLQFIPTQEGSSPDCSSLLWACW